MRNTMSVQKSDALHNLAAQLPDLLWQQAMGYEVSQISKDVMYENDVGPVRTT